MACSRTQHVWITGGNSSTMEIPPNTVCECGKYRYAEFSELEAIIDRLQAEVTRLRAENADYKQSIEQMCNDLWSLLYPDDPTGWEYRTQPLVHIRVELNQLQAEVRRRV